MHVLSLHDDTGIGIGIDGGVADGGGVEDMILCEGMNQSNR